MAEHHRGGHEGGGRGKQTSGQERASVRDYMLTLSSGGREGGGQGEHHGKGDGSHREELRDDLTDIHHDRKKLEEADTPEERKKAQKELNKDEGGLKKDWGKDMPEHAGEAHHGGGGGGRGKSILLPVCAFSSARNSVRVCGD